MSKSLRTRLDAIEGTPIAETAELRVAKRYLDTDGAPIPTNRDLLHLLHWALLGGAKPGDDVGAIKAADERYVDRCYTGADDPKPDAMTPEALAKFQPIDDFLEAEWQARVAADSSILVYL